MDYRQLSTHIYIPQLLIVAAMNTRLPSKWEILHSSQQQYLLFCPTQVKKLRSTVCGVFCYHHTFSRDIVLLQWTVIDKYIYLVRVIDIYLSMCLTNVLLQRTVEKLITHWLGPLPTLPTLPTLPPSPRSRERQLGGSSQILPRGVIAPILLLLVIITNYNSSKHLK